MERKVQKGDGNSSFYFDEMYAVLDHGILKLYADYDEPSDKPVEKLLSISLCDVTFKPQTSNGDLLEIELPDSKMITLKIRKSPKSQKLTYGDYGLEKFFGENWLTHFEDHRGFATETCYQYVSSFFDDKSESCCDNSRTGLREVFKHRTCNHSI